jgi:hypothetical protein
MTTERSDIIFILGMGRTGSSALARVLSLCGGSLPRNLLAPKSDNPTGFWEPEDGLKLNDAILFNHGATWFDPTMRLQLENVFSEQEQREYVNKMTNFLEECAAPILVIKEPRITALTDLWFAAAKRANFRIKVVIRVRHPTEVAASLATRDGASVALSSVLWLKYNLLAEWASRDVPRVFVEYSSLLEDWRAQISRVSRALDVDLHDRHAADVDAFLLSELQHNHWAGDPIEPFGQNWMSTVHRAYSAAAMDAPLDLRIIDEIFGAFTSCERAFRTALREFDERFAPVGPSADAG